eukprot:TRINITY_DN2906_c1_g1_i1.p1 TRINITY_DN2906_c1_g1~~TRINITY_DN2906_c1_g1_i1.p1  ORF type:complete len:308 (-),score=92.12 TRINITY_DN2906_c1_g1_i1:62-985(-)
MSETAELPEKAVENTPVQSTLDWDNVTVSQLKGQWELASIHDFCLTFGHLFDIKPFFCEELEQCLIRPRDAFVGELHMKLLRELPEARRNPVNWTTWEPAVYGFVNRRRFEFPEDIVIDKQYKNIPLRSRVLVLQGLCEWLASNSEGIAEVIREQERLAKGDLDQFRTEPLGTDSEGRNYYCFDYNLRLYRDRLPTDPDSDSDADPVLCVDVSGTRAEESLANSECRRFPQGDVVVLAMRSGSVGESFQSLSEIDLSGYWHQNSFKRFLPELVYNGYASSASDFVVRCARNAENRDRLLSVARRVWR